MYPVRGKKFQFVFTSYSSKLQFPQPISSRVHCAMTCKVVEDMLHAMTWFLNFDLLTIQINQSVRSWGQTTIYMIRLTVISRYIKRKRGKGGNKLIRSNILCSCHGKYLYTKWNTPLRHATTPRKQVYIEKKAGMPWTEYKRRWYIYLTKNASGLVNVNDLSPPAVYRV